ncbi:MAG: 2-dehydropantoate 2-reductase [Candidatus Omnitrophica bacterium]|nr:2-dehydropantoate 2-reductase [Candidatus Omnitrophota bacterium]
MKIAVIGAGGIGSVVAAYLFKAGVDVTLVGRQDQIQVVSDQGLRLDGVRGEDIFQVPIIHQLDQCFDLVIFTVKTQDLEGAYQQNARYLEQGLILTTQNGVQADNILSVHFDRQKMFSSIVMFGATYIEPGKVTFNFEGDWIIGKPFTPNEPKIFEIEKILNQAFKVVVVNDIAGMKWLKLFVNFNNCIPAVIGKSMQETFGDHDLCRLSIMLLKEGVDIVQQARIEMVSLPHLPVDRVCGLAQMPMVQAAGIINKTLTTLSEEPLYGSILQSIFRKKPSEIDFINGEVIQLGHHIHQKALLNSRIVDMVHRVEQTGQFFEIDEVKNIFEL